MAPPCVLVTDAKAHTVQTFVVSGPIAAKDAMKELAQDEGIRGAGIWIIVETLEEANLVITVRECNYESRVRKFKDQLRPFDVQCSVLSRRLQRKFAWGDAKLPEEESAGYALSSQEYWLHPLCPQRFYVIEKQDSNTEKIIWIRQELGDDADLAEFCEKYIELYGETVRGVATQKSKCLALFGEYSPQHKHWVRESSLPPEELETFQRVWNPDAPQRCRECSTVLKQWKTHDNAYCCNKCKTAGRVRMCKTCKRTPGSNPENRCCFMSHTQGTDELSQTLQRHEAMLERAHFLSGQEDVVDESHEQAWKRRRRS